MPESFITPLDDRCFALESFIEHTTGAQHQAPNASVIRNNYGRSQAAIADADRLKAAIFTPKPQLPLPTIAKSRRKRARSSEEKQAISPRKGSSIHYGVRFRADLRKWVAEIRVAEWKDVDKKAWLGTFDTEEGAARGVDLARKLLKCAKKRRANLPCPELEQYCTTIPAHLDLTDLADEAMFKDVVSFVKNESQTYSAQFTKTTTTTTTTVVQPQPQIFTPNSHVGYEEVDVLWNHDNFEPNLPDPHFTSISHSIVSDFDMAEILEDAFGPFIEFDGCSSRGSSSEPSSFSGQGFRPQSDSFGVGIARGALPVAAVATGAWEVGVDSSGVRSTLEVEPVCHDLAAVYGLPQTWPGAGAFQLPGLEAEHSPRYMPGDTGDMTFFDLANTGFKWT